MFNYKYSSSQKRKIIFNHYQNPKNKKEFNLNDKKIIRVVSNSCSDELFFKYEIKNNKFASLIFRGDGCAIAIASADIFINLVKKHPQVKMVKNLNQTYKDFISGQKNVDKKILGQLMAFEKIYKNFDRKECALLITKAIDEIFKILNP